MIRCGGMGEWLKPTDLKSVKAARSSGVRIPLPPPHMRFKGNFKQPFLPISTPSATACTSLIPSDGTVMTIAVADSLTI